MYQGVTQLSMAIFGTGAGSNLTREELLPTNSHAYAKLFRSPLRVAGDKTFSVKGMVRLQVDIGGKAVSTFFGVPPLLTTEAILRKVFIGEHVELIESSHCLIVSRKRNSTPILASLSKNLVSHLREGHYRDGKWHICTVVRARTIPPHLLAPVVMRTEGLGTCILQPVERTITITELFIGKEIVGVAPN